MPNRRALPGARFWPMAALTTALLVLTPSVAWAHGEGESNMAFDLVRQAIGLIVNTPDDTAAIEDKINDALHAEDKSDVKMPPVQRAIEALDSGDLDQTRLLLEVAIGARSGTDSSEPVRLGTAPPVTGEETGTLAATDPLPGRDGLSGGDWALLIASVLVGLMGAAAAFWLRPESARTAAVRRGDPS
ncbi:MAG: hypothetical protein ABJA86_06735 [Nocardioidaceae bacterium]